MNEQAMQEILEAAKAQELFKGKTIVFEKNENSTLGQKVKPCSTEFFELLFNRDYWQFHSSLGLSGIPFKSNYAGFVSSELLFCKNTERRFLDIAGLEKEFSVSKGKIIETAPISFANIMFILAMPFELARNSASVSIAAFKINSMLDSFQEHYENSREFWLQNQIPKEPAETARQALEGALQSMKFSLAASLAFSLKISLKDCSATKESILEKAVNSANSRPAEETIKEFGFFSLTPYDVSRPFMKESQQIMEFLKSLPLPKGRHYVLRENARLCAAMHLSILRECFFQTAKKTILDDNAFFLKPSELSLAFSQPEKAMRLCLERKAKLSKDSEELLPKKIAVSNCKVFFEEVQESSEVSGLSVGAQNTAKGSLVFVKGPEDNGKVQKGDIVFCKSFSPELVVFYSKCSAVLSESGSMLSHSAIVAREQEIPCIVQLKGAMLLKENSIIEVDGKTGKVKIQQAR